MKTIPVSFLVAGILLPAACLAQPPEPDMNPRGNEKGGHRSQDRPFFEAWKTADTNDDGFISHEEFDLIERIQKLPADKRDHVFKRLDKNDDDKLSRGELGRLVKSQGGPPDRPMMRLWELDADKSGGVSFEEFTVGPLFKKLPVDKQQMVFERLDTNGDGVITPQDRPEPPHKRQGGKPRPPSQDGKRQDRKGGAEPFNGKLDVDGDGALSFEEFREGLGIKKLTEDEQEDRFERIDRNGDQKLTPEEFSPRPPPPRAE